MIGQRDWTRTVEERLDDTRVVSDTSRLRVIPSVDGTVLVPIDMLERLLVLAGYEPLGPPET